MFFGRQHRSDIGQLHAESFDAKNRTFKKTQNRAVTNGAEQVKKQDQAMWSALTGTETKKCLRAVTVCAGVSQGAIGHSTTFFGPGTNAAQM